MTTPQRNKARAAFAEKVREWPIKIQIGARGAKNGASWIAVDLYDKSDLIDHNWDLQNLPLEDGSVDCFVCNAVLEHVPRPDLAVYEMYRTLKVGGQIWVEVPFLQFYHAHPHDFTRWTLPGIKILMEDFREIDRGIAADAAREISRYVKYANSDARFPDDQKLENMATKYVSDRIEKWGSNPRFYSSVYFWGEKTKSDILVEKKYYMEAMKKRLVLTEA